MNARNQVSVPTSPRQPRTASASTTWTRTAWCSGALLLLTAGCASGPQRAALASGEFAAPPAAAHTVASSAAPREQPRQDADSEWVDDGVWEPLESNQHTLGGLTRDLFRGRHPVGQPEGGFKVRTDLYRTTFDGSSDLDLQVGLDYGVTDRLTLGLELGPHPVIRSFERVVGASDTHTGISAMYGLMQQEDQTLALRLDVLYSDDRLEYRPAVIGGSRMSEDLEVYAGVGAALADEPGRTERLTYDFAAAHRISRAVVGAVELDGALGRGGFHEIYVTPGIIFNARRRLQARIGSPIGLTSDSADYQILAGMTVLF